jgi:hypothetical protein
VEGEVRSTQDHEEWTKIVADSDTGAYVMQGFVVHDRTMNRPVTDERTVGKALRLLARRKGWDEQLTGYAGPLGGMIPTGGDVRPPGVWRRWRVVAGRPGLLPRSSRRPGAGIPRPAGRLRAGLSCG